MSDHNHDSSDNLIVGLVGKAFYVLIPVILIVMMGIVGAAFLGGGGYKSATPDRIDPPKPPLPWPPPTAEQMALGKTTWVQCFACHGAEGQGGAANMAPPLVGSAILLGNPEASLSAVHKGIVKGPESKWLGVMVGLSHLSDEQIAAVLTYARNSFGNEAAPIKPEQSAEVRKKLADRAGSFTREELEQMVK